jgi:hypothetical protein
MKMNKLVIVSAIVVVLIILLNSSLVEGYSPQYNAQGNVDRVKDAITFVTQDGYDVQLANVGTRNLSDVSILEDYLPYNQAIYFDILNQSISQNKPTFTAVVYLSYDDTSYVNLNKILMQKPKYEFLFDCDDITPYTWNEFVPKEMLTNSTNGVVDLSSFEQNRASLIDTYNSQTLAHVGYIVTVTLAIVALFVTIPSNETKIARIFGKNSKLLITVTFFCLLTLFVFFLYRLIFWSWMTSAVLGVTPQESISRATPTLASGIQDYLTNNYKDHSWLALTNLFYYLDQKYFFLFSSLLITPVILFASQCFVNLVTIKTKVNTQIKYFIIVVAAVILLLNIPYSSFKIVFPYSVVSIILLDILCGIFFWRIKNTKGEQQNMSPDPI